MIETPKNSDLFFAYGTLKRRRINGLVRLGPAAMRGALVSLGAYPGLIEGGRGLVRGAVFRIADPRAFIALDAYEGEDFPRVRARLCDGRESWVYVWRGARKGWPIGSGRW